MRVSQRASRWLLLLLGVTTCVYAQQLAELSDEFLEYLGSLEGEDEDWMDFVAVAAASSSASSSSSASKTMAKASSSSGSSATSVAKTKDGAQDGKVQK